MELNKLTHRNRIDLASKVGSFTICHLFWYAETSVSPVTDWALLRLWAKCV